jgi:hypothetical protein
MPSFHTIILNPVFYTRFYALRIILHELIVNAVVVQVLCHLLLLVTEAPQSEAEEPANRAGLAFLRGLFHHEGHMWLGAWAVDVQSIVFSGFAARGAFTERKAATSNAAAAAEVGWTSWGPWSACGAGGVQTRGRRCALRNGTGEVNTLHFLLC